MLYPDAEARRRTVLVVVVNNPDDLRRAAAEGWYRIPQRRAPRRIGADYLAFYQTGAFKEQAEAQTVTYFAPTRRYRLLTRRELLPTEAGHPRADEFYFRIDIGPLQRLARPIPAEKYHRVTFIHTTLDRLLTATDVTELFRKDDPVETLWQALREHRLRPLKNRLVGEQPVDIALRARGGYLGIRCLEDSATHEAAAHLLPDRWELLHFSVRQIEEDLTGCLRQVGAALIQLGGSVLNAPQPER
ncbi:MAG: hypothetical protein KJZ93_15375 [Caldilineaceae bacterium]|nr:hypothetical protein [Caldilineaceae bacterium]